MDNSTTKVVTFAACILISATSFAVDTPVTPTAPTTTPSTPATPTATPATTAASTDLTKDAWFGQLTPVLPEMICKAYVQNPDFKKKFDEFKMTYEQCVVVMPTSISKCQTQLSPNMPATITNTDSGTWENKFGVCIGQDFISAHLMAK